MTRTLDIDAMVATRDEADDELKAAITILEEAVDNFDRLVAYRDRFAERQAPEPVPEPEPEPEIVAEDEPADEKPVVKKATAPKRKTKSK